MSEKPTYEALEKRVKDLEQAEIEHKRAEGALLESTDLFRTLSDLAPSGIYLCDVKGNCRYANPRWCEMAGLSMEDALGDGWAKGLHPEDRDFVFSKWQQLIESEGKWGLEYRFQTPGGKITWVYGLATPQCDASGNIVAYVGINTDITERKKAEDALRQMNERLLLTLQAAKAGTWDWDVIAGRMEWSTQMFDLFGLDPLKNTPSFEIWKNILYPQDVELAVARIDQALKRQTTLYSDYRIVLPDGQIRWINAVGKGQYDEQGRPIRMIGICMEITERKRAAAALIESEKRYRLLFQNLNAGFALHEIILNTHGNPCDYRFLELNPAFEKLTGLKAEEIAGKTVLQVMPDTELYWIETYGKVAKTGESIFFENYSKELGKHYVVTAYAPEPGKFATIFLDITDRKKVEDALQESEEKFRNFADQSLVGIYLVQDSVFKYLNPKFSEIFGYTVEQCLGLSFDELVHPEDLNTVKENVGKRISGEVKTVHYEFRGVRKNSEIIHLEIFGSSTLFNGKPAATGTLLDITEIKQVEEEKAKLNARLLQAQKLESIGSLAGGIAHDLNNILFPISGLSEMLLDDMPPDNPEYESLQQIHKSAQRGSDLVKQILAFSRQGNPQKLPIRIQPILKEVMKLVRATIPMNIEITSHIKPDCGLVSADPTQVHQIAMNLITNAYHAVEGNGGTINIALKEMEFERDDLHDNAMPGVLSAGRYACISISDTGTGMGQELINKIFDPYFTTKGMGKGTGLGLSVVHGIVKQHGGDIRIYSEVGKGTTFNVYFPLLEGASDSKTAAVTRKYPTGCESILLVDDEEPILRMEQIMLERLGYQVTARSSSPDALDAFREDPLKFDVVISDRGMPKMTGEQLARELISIRPEIPVILCSGFGDENDQQRARAMGVKGFLMKPVATGDLADMVRKVLDEVASGELVNPSGQPDETTQAEKRFKDPGNDD